jgi:hypothetical protein
VIAVKVATNRFIALFSSPLFAGFRRVSAMASSCPLPEEAPIDDRVLQWKHNAALSSEERDTRWKLVRTEHKNKVERIGTFVDGKIFGMTRRRVNKDGSLGTRDHCCVLFQASNTKLVLRSQGAHKVPERKTPLGATPR